MKTNNNFGTFMNIKTIRKIYNKKFKMFGLGQNEIGVVVPFLTVSTVLIIFFFTIISIFNIKIPFIYILIFIIISSIFIFFIFKKSNKKYGNGVIFFIFKKFGFISGIKNIFYYLKDENTIKCKNKYNRL